VEEMAGQDAWWFMSLLALVLLAAMSLAPLLAPRKKPEQWKSITRLKCAACGYTEEREFSKGDYVGKVVGQCPKCGGRLVVDAIFRRKIEPQEHRH
jgi:predicted nucleic-acid-binding Zn-ribbon protein